MAIVFSASAALETGTYYTAGGNFYAYNSGWVDITSDMASVEVTVNGNNVSIVGLAYWFEDGAIQGTMDGNTITFASGQKVGTDEYGDEFLTGTNDGETVTDIVFEFDPEAKTLTAKTAYILENASATSTSSVYCYWSNAVFSAEQPAEPEVVVLPENVQTSTYKFDGTDSYTTEPATFQVQVGFDGNDVYFQGLSYYLPEAWVKGTLAAGVVTIPETYLGVFESYIGDYKLTLGATTMTYDATNDKFTCAAYVSTGSGYAFDEYENITLSKLTEVAATPVEPQITEFAVAGETYPKVNFNISLTGTNGEDLLESKTSYTFFVQKGNESSPLELTTDLYEMLEANMTEIPYTFSDDYDIYNSRLYLNQGETELRSWDKLGLQVIYRGAGEEHKSTINWFDVRAYWAEVDGEATAVENANVAVKAIKSIKDAQLIIRANGKIFNAQGVEIR